MISLISGRKAGNSISVADASFTPSVSPGIRHVPIMQNAFAFSMSVRDIVLFEFDSVAGIVSFGLWPVRCLPMLRSAASSLSVFRPSP